MSNHPAFFFWNAVIFYRFGICNEHEEYNEHEGRGGRSGDRGTRGTRSLPATMTWSLPATMRDSFEKAVAVNLFQTQIFEMDVANMATARSDWT